MGKSNLRRFKMEPRYKHKRSEGLRRVANHPASRLIEEDKMSRHSGMALMYGNPPDHGPRVINEKMAEFLGWPVCKKCKRHYKPDEACPFCAREAEKNYKALIDIEEGKK